MASTSEYNQFRRYIGDYKDQTLSTSAIDAYLNDTTRELTSDFVDSTGVITPVTDFNLLVVQYHPEVILKSAINWWWERAAELSDKHSQSMGEASQNVSEKWDRAMEMIRRLQEQYEIIQELQTDITIGNLSYFKRGSLRRIGGQSEEAALDA